MSQSYSLADEGEAIVTLQRAIDLGCTFFDTTQGYRLFTDEELLGRAFARGSQSHRAFSQE